MSAFSHYFKDFAIVTMASYNSKSSSRYDVCLGALVLAHFVRSPGLFDVHQFHTIIGFRMVCCMLLIFWMSIKEIKKNPTFLSGRRNTDTTFEAKTAWEPYTCRPIAGLDKCELIMRIKLILLLVI